MLQTQQEERGSMVPIGKACVSQQLGITKKTLRSWINQEKELVASSKGSRMVLKKGRRGEWNEMEEELHRRFLILRAEGIAIGRRWFCREGQQIFAEVYDGKEIKKCEFSDGWFKGFCYRWNISWRMRTKVAQEAPVEKEAFILRFLQEIRQKSQPQGRFPLSRIYNMDQTPLPFEFLDTRTYAPRGSKTVWIRKDNPSWTKRQATLMLTACADGIYRCPPIVIFHGMDGRETQCRIRERAKYHPGVRVIFNSTAYSNEQITLDWILTDICSMQSPYDNLQPERLVVLDVFSAQKTAEVLKTMTDLHITPVYVPEGCTGYVQPMDTVLNKVLKDKIPDFLDSYLAATPGPINPHGDKVGARRIAITHAVGQAWEWLHAEKQHSIVKAFKQAGISLSSNGSEDHLLYIRGLQQPTFPIGPHIDLDEEIEFIQPPRSRSGEQTSRISISSLCT